MKKLKLTDVPSADKLLKENKSTLSGALFF